MKRKIIDWNWENTEAQKSFLEWQGMPNNEQTSNEVSKIEALLSINPPLKMLDIGCGTGRQSIEFALRGYDVTGIDVAETYLSQAIEKSKELNLNTTFEFKRGSQLTEENIYDFAIAYNHTLGFMDDSELQAHFSNIYKSLKLSGKFLLKTEGPKLTPSLSQTHKRNWAEKNNQYILSEKYIENGYRIENCITIDLDKNEIIEYREKQKAFSMNDVINLLSSSGFSKVDCFKDLDGDIATAEEFGLYLCIK